MDKGVLLLKLIYWQPVNTTAFHHFFALGMFCLSDNVSIAKEAASFNTLIFWRRNCFPVFSVCLNEFFQQVTVGKKRHLPILSRFRSPIFFYNEADVPENGNYLWLCQKFKQFPYCAFHKHENSKVQKLPSQLRFSLLSIIITITSNEP